MNNVESKTSGIYYGWFIIAVLFTIWTVVFGVQNSFGIFFRSLQDALQCSRGTISLAMSINLLVFALIMVPAGWVMERFNIRIVYSLAAFGIGIPLILCSRVSEPWHLYLVYGLLGVSTGIYGPSIYTVIIRWFTKKRGVALGLASAGAGFGQLLGAPLINASIASYGWRNTFVILGGASFVILFACTQFIRNPPEQASNGQGPSQGGISGSKHPHRQDLSPQMSFGEAIRTRQIMFIIAGSGAAQITSRMVAVHIAPHATDMGASPFIAAMALSTIGGGSVLGRIVMGFVQDRIGAQRSMIICLLTMGICLSVLPFIASDIGFIAFAILFGLAFGGDLPQAPALTAQCFGVASMNVVYAFVAGTVVTSSSIGPIAAGYVFDITHSYTIAFLAAALLLFLGVFSISRIK